MYLYHEKMRIYATSTVSITDYCDRHATIKEGYKCERMKNVSSYPTNTIYSNSH